MEIIAVNQYNYLIFLRSKLFPLLPYETGGLSRFPYRKAGLNLASSRGVNQILECLSSNTDFEIIPLTAADGSVLFFNTLSVLFLAGIIV